MPHADSGHGRVDVDYVACLRMGLTGALGAIPGTLCAHPLDVFKIRMQTTPNTTYRQAAAHITTTAGGYHGFYRGLMPAIQQRCIARFPMFFLSEAFTQTVERTTSLEGAQARFVGSVGSGYTTGVLAALAEYRKKLLSQGVVGVAEAHPASIVRSAIASGHRRSLLRRVHAAGICSAVYDSFFFTTELHLHDHRGWAAGYSYGGAAATVVAASGTAVARLMVVPPSKPVAGIFSTVANLVRDGKILGAFSGLRARVCEFGVSYAITGVVGVLVKRAM